MIRLLARLTALSCLLLAPLATAQAQIGDSSQPLDTIADRIENLDDQGRTVRCCHGACPVFLTLPERHRRSGRL